MEQKCYYGLVPYTLTVDLTGDDVASVFPLLTKVASFKFDQPLGIMGLQLSSSLTNVTAEMLGVFVMIGSGAAQDQITLTNSVNSGCWITQLTNLNAVPGFASPASRTTMVNFANDTGIQLNSGDEIAIFACSDSDADNLISACLNIYTILTK